MLKKKSILIMDGYSQQAVINNDEKRVLKLLEKQNVDVQDISG